MSRILDAEGFGAHLRAWKIDPGVGARLRRRVRGQGREPAEAARGLDLPAEWLAGLAGSCLGLRERVDSGADGATKLLFATDSGACFETVLLRRASGRNALCLSIQSRCPVACTFCASGTTGDHGRLGLEELLEQVLVGRSLLREEGRVLRNLVFMGMGEPLLEPRLLHGALEALLDPAGFAFAPRQLTVSTVGLPREMVRLAQRFPGVRQALSLHAARQEVRGSIIPLARRHDLEELRRAVCAVTAATGGEVFVEVLLLAGVTDRPADLEALVAWLDGLAVRVNLIPFNPPDPGAVLPPAASLDPRLVGSSPARVGEMAAALRAAGHRVTTRRSLGGDIAAACGQLAARTP